MVTLSIILFIIGFLLLLFGNPYSGDSDLFGFILIVVAFIIALIN